MRGFTVASVCITAAVGGLALRANAGDAVAMFRGDAAHSGVYASQAPHLTSVRWRFHAGGKIISSPAIADGNVYVGSFDQNLYALNARTGECVGTLQTKGPVNSSPAIANVIVYFSSLDGNVYAVGAANGRERWRF